MNKYLNLVIFVVILFLIANIVLFALKIITVLLFWGIIIAAALFAYKMLPKLKKL